MFSISAFWKAGSLPNNFMSRTQTRKESTPHPTPPLQFILGASGLLTLDGFSEPGRPGMTGMFPISAPGSGNKPRQLASRRMQTHTEASFYERTQTHPQKPRSAHAAQGAAERDRAPLERRPEPYRPIFTKAECQRLLFDSGHQECGNNTRLTGL